jgi:hypothetical protein
LPDWRRLIIGDAFALQSRDPNFFRDRFLVFPFLLSTIMAVTAALGPAHDYRAAMKCAVVSVLAILLARERLVLIGASLGFVCLQSLISFALKPDPIALAVSIVSGVAVLLVIRWMGDYKPSYSVTKGTTISTVLVMLVSGVFTFAILHFWIRP